MSRSRFMSNPPNPPPTSERPRRRRPARLVPQDPVKITDWVMVGKIVAPFGIRGQVKVQIETDFPASFSPNTMLYLGAEHRPIQLVLARPQGHQLVLELEGIADRNASEALRGQEVYIPADRIAPLATDQYFIRDLIGLRAIRIDGVELGQVADVITGAMQDLLVIHSPGREEVTVPLVKALVPNIDIPHGTITIQPPAGLFDDDFEEA